LEQSLVEICDAFGNPAQWSTQSNKDSLPGANRPHVFQLANCAGIEGIATLLENAKIRNIAVIGINPIAISAGLILEQRNFKVSLIASGAETTSVQAAMQNDTVASLFKRYGITFYPRTAKSLKGSQVHCQSGYCGFVCEGRFIKESEEVGCVVTDGGPIFADAVIIV